MESKEQNAGILTKREDDSTKTARVRCCNLMTIAAVMIEIVRCGVVIKQSCCGTAPSFLCCYSLRQVFVFRSPSWIIKHFRLVLEFSPTQKSDYLCNELHDMESSDV